MFGKLKTMNEFVCVFVCVRGRWKEKIFKRIKSEENLLISKGIEELRLTKDFLNFCVCVRLFLLV